MTDTTPAMPDLDILAERINAEHRACEVAVRTAVQHAINAGSLLLEAKGRCPHGSWLPWLTEHFAGSERTAQAYMRIARQFPQLDDAEAQRVADLPLREALRELAEPRAEAPPTSYEEDVARAAETLAELEDAQWDLARLTHEAASEAGENTSEFDLFCASVAEATNIAYTSTQGLLYKRIWERYGHLPIEDRPLAQDALNEAADIAVYETVTVPLTVRIPATLAGAVEQLNELAGEEAELLAQEAAAKAYIEVMTRFGDDTA